MVIVLGVHVCMMIRRPAGDDCDCVRLPFCEGDYQGGRHPAGEPSKLRKLQLFQSDSRRSVNEGRFAAEHQCLRVGVRE